MKAPYLFDEFFSSGKEESISPFLTEHSRAWGKNLSLKSAGGAACLLILAFASSFSNLPLSYLFLSCVYFLTGVPALLASLKDLKNLEINIDVLMTLAAFMAACIGSSLEGALLLVLFELSHGIEETVSKKAKSALLHLNTLAPKFATVIDAEGILFEKAVRDIPIGTRLLIRNGEIVPLDAKVVEGISSVNLVHLTGESLPVPKSIGDELPAGARNLEAALHAEVVRISTDSTLSRIIQLITQAQEAKPRLQRWLDQFGKQYASSIIGFTFLFAVGAPLLFSLPYAGLEGSIYRALAFLIAASPCALIIATPTAYLSAISACARSGILLKGGITLDALASCKTIAFDKTGTLTTGDLTCLGMEPVGSVTTSLDQALSVAYSLEMQVVHPIATAICKWAQEKGCKPAPIQNFQAIPGHGVQGTLENGVPVQIQRADEKTSNELLVSLHIGADRFLFRFSDKLRKNVKEILSELIDTCKLRPIMLTGDRREIALSIGEQIGIEEIHAELKPEDKLEKVAKLSDESGLAMVGDGINDAPALMRATAGISMGKIGSATAVDASDVVLLSDDLSLLPWLFRKSRQTLRIVKQNITVALIVICFATLPALLGWIPIWIAVILHEGGTVLVGLNSLRLLRR
jgi:Cd2+/Zn2+-exporting ATPase